MHLNYKFVEKKKKSKLFANDFSYTCNPDRTEKSRFPFKILITSLLALGYFYLGAGDLLGINKNCFVSPRVYNFTNLILR